MFTKKMILSCIGAFFSPPEFWVLILIMCFITCKTKDILKLHNRVLVKKAYIFTVNWNKMKIGSSVSDSAASVEWSKLARVRHPLRFWATAGEGTLYVLCAVFRYKA